ncbi:MAG: hypothetical protein HMLIMOIP_002104 [Candidatus Nitrosomirales archaeon]|jgi:hypothetical protein
MLGREFVIGPYPALYMPPKMTTGMYGMLRKHADKFAKSINRELAEGPTLFLPYNHYGPVELWPLVMEEGDRNPISG